MLAADDRERIQHLIGYRLLILRPKIACAEAVVVADGDQRQTAGSQHLFRESFEPELFTVLLVGRGMRKTRIRPVVAESSFKDRTGRDRSSPTYSKALVTVVLLALVA